MLAGSFSGPEFWQNLSSVPRRHRRPAKSCPESEEGMDRGGLDGNLKGLESIQRGGPEMRVEGERKESDTPVSLQGTEVQGKMSGREWLS